jgi:hypothetical protein
VGEGEVLPLRSQEPSVTMPAPLVPFMPRLSTATLRLSAWSTVSCESPLEVLLPSLFFYSTRWMGPKYYEHLDR